MTDEQIIKKAIEKAVKNGYTAYSKNIEQVKDKERFLETIVKSILKEESVYEIIFSHDFAKAFFGEEITKAWKLYDWQFHLSSMVLMKNKLKYLEKFL